MGRNKPGVSKSNPIFKVVGGKAGKVKGKTQEVSTRLKHVRGNLFGKMYSLKRVREKITFVKMVWIKWEEY